MKYAFHPEAQAELDQAADYYNACQPHLGGDFAREVYATIQNILSHPKAWAPLSKHTRRCLVHRFPYGVIYQLEARTIRIIAVMHLSRKPGYWKNRVAEP
jgi:plasmid stabilization system protein ParE